MGRKNKIKNSRKNKINNTPPNQKINEEEDLFDSKSYDKYIFLGIFVFGIIFLLIYLSGLILVLI
ncbi:MAG: hypothetical protein Q7I96_07325 [Methanobacteriaceae archaeon]|nr:hypothetical protein [Methanobacteriaceae archaeon]